MRGLPATVVAKRLMRTSLLAAVLVASVPTLLAPPLLARAGPTLIGSTDDGTLVVFAADRPQAIRTVRATGCQGSADLTVRSSADLTAREAAPASAPLARVAWYAPVRLI